MKSIILCEGSSDYVLIQYYMRKAHLWEDKGIEKNNCREKIKYIRTLVKGQSYLSIGGCGGCSRIIPAFDYLLKRNKISVQDESFDNIVIITDRDEVGTEEIFVKRIRETLDKYQVLGVDRIGNNEWLCGYYLNGRNKKCELKLLLLIIPFEETGAMETFLLNAISANDEYDAGIIKNCNRFVDEIDVEKRYLTKRRYITKSKFDVYFSVRTAAEQFVERQNIFLNIPWEQYVEIQKSFKQLADLG